MYVKKRSFVKSVAQEVAVINRVKRKGRKEKDHDTVNVPSRRTV